MKRTLLTPDLELKMSTLNRLRVLAKEFNDLVDNMAIECGVLAHRPHRKYVSPVAAANVVQIVKDIYGLDITRKAQFPQLVTARCAAAYVMQVHCKMSLSEIGSTLGGKHHTTILNNIRNAEDRLRAKDEAFTEMVGKLEDAVFDKKLKVA